MDPSRPSSSNSEHASRVATAAGTSITAVVFDLGGVLIDWDPRHLYRQLFDDPDEMERFLAEVTTAEWNRSLDAGRSWVEAVDELVALHPERRHLIEAYHGRWPEMLGGAIEGTVEILAEVRATGLPVYALSNWSAETYPVTRGRFPFLDWFDGVVISGEIGVAKPDAGMFEALIEHYGVVPERTVFIDDVAANIRTADGMGFRTIRFQGPEALRRSLAALDVLPRA
jgi:2-haloacid dehalogenase